MDGQEKKQPTASKLVAEAKKKIESLPCTNTTDFLSGVREIAKEFNKKAVELEENIVVCRDDLQHKLEDLRRYKNDLLNLKEDIVSLRDEYLNNAKKVAKTLQEKDPHILVKLEEVTNKQTTLKRMQLNKDGQAIIENLKLALKKDFTSEIFVELEEYLVRAKEHERIISEFDPSMHDFSSEFSEICQKAVYDVKGKLCQYLENFIKYPFEEDDMKFVTEEAENITKGFLRLLFKLSSQLASGTEMETLSTFMFEPVQDRFIFHFYGTRKTNDKGNPRWFLTQLLSWTRACIPFYERMLFAVAKEFGVSKQKINGRFHAKISQLAIKKINSLLSDDEVICDSYVFSNLIDECVDFEEQRQLLDTGGHGQNTLSPFCESDIIKRWTQMENEISTCRVDDILAEENGWKNRLGELVEVDDYNVCRSADAFVTLVTCMRNRVRMLPDQVAKRRFVDLQLVLFDDFLKRLTQISNQAESPWVEPFPQIMNAVWYLCDTVQEWNDSSVLFEASSTNPSLEYTSKMYKHVWSQMADDVVTSVRIQALDLAHHYQQQRWSSVEPLFGGLRELSPLFCPLLMQLRSSFASAASLISKASVAFLFKRMTAVVADLILKEIVMPTSFVESGASQMLFDIEQGLLPVMLHIFQRSGIEGMNPEYNESMTKVLSSLRLLSLSWPVASLLREEISNASTEIVEEKLSEMKIVGISPEDAMRLFNQRSDMQSGNLMKVR